MAYSQARLKRVIRRYVNCLRKEIPVSRVILFGSYAWGKPKPYSDIDLAVFSRKFRGRNELKDMQYLFKRACEVDPFIEPLPFHPREMKKPDRRTFLYRILKEGKRMPLL